MRLCETCIQVFKMEETPSCRKQTLEVSRDTLPVGWPQRLPALGEAGEHWGWARPAPGAAQRADGCPAPGPGRQGRVPLAIPSQTPKALAPQQLCLVKSLKCREAWLWPQSPPHLSFWEGGNWGSYLLLHRRAVWGMLPVHLISNRMCSAQAVRQIPPGR